MCGVIGLFHAGEEDVFPDAVNGLFQMQHRGQDACGIALADGRIVRHHKGIGHVREVFPSRPLPDFSGFVATGHVRYPTQGDNRVRNTQPHVVSTLRGTNLALSSNGDLTNYHTVRARLEEKGVDFLGTNDAELILKFIAWEHLEGGCSLLEAIRRMQREVRGAYSATLVTGDALYAIRDPWALRPLCFGTSGVLHVVASETPALDIARVDLVDEVGAGEVVHFGREGITRHPHPDVASVRHGSPVPAHCIFEHVYFSRPDSIAFGERVYDVRRRIGAWLARHEDEAIDVVVPVPDSSNAIALGYAHESGVPFEFGLIRNHYVGRTFIHPDQARRDDGVKQKFNPLRSVFKGRRVALVDDSIVRGTTLRKLTRMVRAAGAAEVHLRIGSPVTRHSCFYGVDTPDAEALIGSRMDEAGICAHLTADSLRYISVEGLREAAAGDGHFCMACFTGEYPEPVREQKASK
ncbi:MAG: amidophosphoribosyltransferase [Deltaproteobacteria bacterium]|nr:MAG: amidophosphoribosyltransferase [Deltaproteobacteria bacterium]